MPELLIYSGLFLGGVIIGAGAVILIAAISISRDAEEIDLDG